MKYLLLMLMLSRCNCPIDASPEKKRKCTSAQITDIDKYVKACVLSDGYIRAKQETEQAVEDARKQALEDVAEGFIKQKSWARDYAFAVVEHAAHEGAIK